ncbi:MAG: hypothetical protein R3258_07890 [Acidimicrobiia bacterium]|nr:hypothetical protein [Acidimicrobiia bacterium]
MPQSQARTLPYLLLVTSMAAATIFLPRIPALADTPEYCGRTILILDESGSIQPHETTVRSAVNAFFTPLIDSDAEAQVVEFGKEANTVFGSYLPIDVTAVANDFGPYVNATAAGEVYDPPSTSGPSTNWDDALDEATQINASSGVAPVVLFLTDGDPTAYNLDQPGDPLFGTVNVSGTTPTAVNRAIEEATELKGQGSHLIGIAVGPALQDPSDSLNRLKAVTGENVYDGTGILDLSATDVILVENFADLPATMALIAQALCANPEITVEKTASSPVVIPGTEVTYQIDVTNAGNVDLHDVVLDDPSVPGCSENIGTLAVGETVTVECSIVLWSPLTNTATATGTDPFGTPVQGEGSASTILIASGTGTPGFWKNHEDVWPVAGDTVLIGDWNHNWVCDPTETCLEMTLAEALAALGTPPRGDMTWNLARPLVAAWLNVSAGNDPTCIATTIDLATAWLLVHPIGSDVPGSDPAWDTASSWAKTLDDYNNGLLCAESRDAGEGPAEGAETESSTGETPATEPENDEAAEDPGAGWDGEGGNPPPHSKGRGKG